MVVIPYTEAGDMPLIPAGTYPAICKFEGLQLRRDFNDPTKKRADLRLVFQLGVKPDGADRYFQKHIWFNRTLADKSNLRAFLKAWRGRDFTPAQIEAWKHSPFDAAKLVGQVALVNIAHEMWKNGKTGDTIASIMPLPPIYPNPPFTVEWYVGEKEKWVQATRDAESYMEAQRGQASSPPPDDQEPTGPGEDDEPLPF